MMYIVVVVIALLIFMLTLINDSIVLTAVTFGLILALILIPTSILVNIVRVRSERIEPTTEGAGADIGVSVHV